MVARRDVSRPPTRGLLANTSANLLVGASALGYGVIVPALVVRRFGPEIYGNWYLAFQVAATTSCSSTWARNTW